MIDLSSGVIGNLLDSDQSIETRVERPVTVGDLLESNDLTTETADGLP